MEKRYDFKRELLNVHKKGRRNFNLSPSANEFVISDGIAVIVPEDADKVIMNAVRDFENYLFISMKTSAFIIEKNVDFPQKLEGKYDLIMLSNIYDYNRLGEQGKMFEKTVDELYNKKLNPGVWWVMKGRADAPPAMVFSTGVSTSM